MKITEAVARDLIRKYSKSDNHYSRIWDHCRIVRDIALWCAGNADEDVDVSLLEQACLVHDIASSVFMGDGFDYAFYQQHALLGAALLLEEGVNPAIADIVKTHIHVAISGDELQEIQARLPYKDYKPATIEGRILNYADRFHSKDPKLVTFESNIQKYSALPLQQKRLRENAELFGVPSLEPFAQKYGHPIT